MGTLWCYFVHIDHKVKELILTMVHELERHTIAKQVKWEGGGGGGGETRNNFYTAHGLFAKKKIEGKEGIWLYRIVI